MTTDRKDEPDDYYVRSRSIDNSWWIKSAYLFEKYRVLVWAIGAILLAFGFGFQTPAAKFDELKQNVRAGDIKLQAQVDTLKEDRLQQRQMMEFSVRYICAQLTDADRYRLGGTDICASAAHSTYR